MLSKWKEGVVSGGWEGGRVPFRQNKCRLQSPHVRGCLRVHLDARPAQAARRCTEPCVDRWLQHPVTSHDPVVSVPLWILCTTMDSWNYLSFGKGEFHLPSVCSSVQLCRLFVTPWTVAHQAPLCMGFPRQEHWSVLPCPPPGDLPNPGLGPTSLVSPALPGGLFTTAPSGKPSLQTDLRISKGLVKEAGLGVLRAGLHPDIYHVMSTPCVESFFTVSAQI